MVRVIRFAFLFLSILLLFSPFTFFGAAASAQSALSVTVLGVTPTQAVLSYNPPIADVVCTIQLSEQSALTPLVNDVNPELFAGSNLDNREGALNLGAQRILVLGKRSAELVPSVGRRFSRALQAYTTHFYRLQCGSSSISGTFRTSNIPTGITYGETLPGDPTKPGEYAWPTLTADRKESVVDPQTGILLKRFTVLGDNLAGVIGASANTEYCSSAAVLDPSGHVGYRCLFKNSLFFVDSPTGEVRFLGKIQTTYRSPAPGIDGLFAGEPRLHFDRLNPDTAYALVQSVVSGGACSACSNLARMQYFGANQDLPSGTYLEQCNAQRTNQPCIEWKILTNSSASKDIASVIRSYSPNLNNFRSAYGFEISGLQSGKIIFHLLASNQDTLGWVIVVDPTSADPSMAGSPAGVHVIAAINTWDHPPGHPARYCALHSVIPWGDTNWINVGPNTLPKDSGPNDQDFELGSGPLVTRLSETMPSTLEPCPTNTLGVTGLRCTTAIVDGEVRDLSPHPSIAEERIPDAAPGDLFWFTNSNAEYIRLIKRSVDPVSGRNLWVFERSYSGPGAITSYPAGSLLQALCLARNYRSQFNAPPNFLWDWKSDPDGENLTGRSVIVDPLSGDHPAYGDGAYVSTLGYWGDIPIPNIRLGAVPDYLTSPQYIVNSAPTVFAGVQATRARIESHSARPVLGTHTNALPFHGGSEPEGVMAQQIGSGLYQLHSSAFGGPAPSSTTIRLDAVRFPIYAHCDTKVLSDVSGPTSSIASAQDFTFCLAKRAGECVTSSSTGDVFIKCSNALDQTGCYMPAWGQSGWSDSMDDLPQVNSRGICVGNPAVFAQAVTQTNFLKEDLFGNSTRVLSRGLSIYRRARTFWSARLLPNSVWSYFDIAPSPLYGQGAGTILLAKVPPFPAVDSVDRTNFVLRKVAIPKAVQNAARAVVDFGYLENGLSSDFFCTSRKESCVAASAVFSSAEPFLFASTDNITGVECLNGCEITVPNLPLRVTYYQVRYLSDSGQTVAVGSKGVLIDSPNLDSLSPPATPKRPVAPGEVRFINR